MRVGAMRVRYSESCTTVGFSRWLALTPVMWHEPGQKRADKIHYANLAL